MELVRLWAHGRIRSTAQRARDDRDEALAAFGLTLQAGVDGGDGEYYLWPENAQAWSLWMRVQTQWRVGMSGPSGLDYAGVKVLMSMMGLTTKVQRELFGLLTMMESAALEAWSDR